MDEYEKNLYLDGDDGLKPYLRLKDSDCGFCKVCRDEPCGIKDGEKCTTNIANYIRKLSRRKTVGKIKGFMLNRKQYQNIRRMDHATLSSWVASVYQSGFKDGEDEANKNSLTIEQVRDALLGLKGFGEKRVSVVCDELSKKMNAD